MYSYASYLISFCLNNPLDHHHQNIPIQERFTQMNNPKSFHNSCNYKFFFTHHDLRYILSHWAELVFGVYYNFIMIRWISLFIFVFHPHSLPLNQFFFILEDIHNFVSVRNNIWRYTKKSLRHKIILYFPDNYFMVICVVGGNIDSSGNQQGESNIIKPIKMAFLKKHHTGLSLFTTRRLMLVLLCIIDFFPILFLYYFFRGVCMCWRLLYVSLWLYTQSSIFIKCFTRHNLISFRCASLTLCDCCSDEAPF